MTASASPAPSVDYPLEPDATRSTGPVLRRDDRALQVEADDDAPIVVSFFAGLDELFPRRSEVRHAR